MIRVGFRALAAIAAGVLVAAPALAATEAEWAAFRADVEAKCLAAAEPLFENPVATVDPFGSPNFGLALVRGKARGADVQIMAICVYDKVTQTAEIGGELPEFVSTAPPAPPGPVGWGGLLDCGEPCADALVRLSPEDAEALIALHETVDATVAEISRSPDLAAETDALAALVRVEAATGAGDLAAVATGEHACTVYWYGFLDDPARTVGRHQCVVEDVGGTLIVTKTTGEMMRATIVPAGDMAVAIGRTYLADQAEREYDPTDPDNALNPNFGNYVGLAFADAEGLLIVDADQHGFTEPDATFFAILAIE